MSRTGNQTLICIFSPNSVSVFDTKLDCHLTVELDLWPYYDYHDLTFDVVIKIELVLLSLLVLLVSLNND